MTESSAHASVPASPARLVKSRRLDTTEFQGELILMNLDSQQVLMLNAAGLALWNGLEIVDTRDAAVALVQEALPAMDPQEIERGVDTLIASLLEGGYLSEMPA
jgi:hypothetical protein